MGTNRRQARSTRPIREFSLAALLVVALCLSAGIPSSGAASTASSGWKGKHLFTLIEYHNDGFLARGVAVVKHGKYNTLCRMQFKTDHRLALGAVFVGYIPINTTELFNNRSVPSCIYLEQSDKFAPIKVIRYASKVTVHSAITNEPPAGALAARPNKYRFSRTVKDGPVAQQTLFYSVVSYPASAVKAIERVEASGKVVTIRIKISKHGLRHLTFVP